MTKIRLTEADEKRRQEAPKKLRSFSEGIGAVRGNDANKEQEEN